MAQQLDASKYVVVTGRVRQIQLRDTKFRLGAVLPLKGYRTHPPTNQKFPADEDPNFCEKRNVSCSEYGEVVSLPQKDTKGPLFWIVGICSYLPVLSPCIYCRNSTSPSHCAHNLVVQSLIYEIETLVKAGKWRTDLLLPFDYTRSFPIKKVKRYDDGPLIEGDSPTVSMIQKGIIRENWEADLIEPRQFPSARESGEENVGGLEGQNMSGNVTSNQDNATSNQGSDQDANLAYISSIHPSLPLLSDDENVDLDDDDTPPRWLCGKCI